MLTNIVTILPVFLIVLSGFGAGRAGVLGPDGATILNRFVVWIALPCLLFDVVATTDWHTYWNPGFAAVSLIGSFAVFAIGLVIGRMRGLSIADMGVDGLNASYCNAVYIGLPLLTLTLGPAVRPHIIVAAGFTLTALFVAGVILIEAGRSHGHGMAGAALHIVKGMARNPVIVSPLAGLIWWWSGLALPAPIHGFLTMLGTAASPAALVAVGLFLAQRPIVHAIGNPNVLALSLVKLVVHPAITAWLAWKVFMLPADIAATAIAVAALPTGTGPFMIAEFYARDGKVTSGTIMVSTIASVATIAGVLLLLRG